MTPTELQGLARRGARPGPAPRHPPQRRGICLLHKCASVRSVPTMGGLCVLSGGGWGLRDTEFGSAYLENPSKAILTDIFFKQSHTQALALTRTRRAADLCTSRGFQLFGKASGPPASFSPVCVSVGPEAGPSQHHAIRNGPQRRFCANERKALSSGRQQVRARAWGWQVQ